MRKAVFSAVGAALVMAACGGGTDGDAGTAAAPEAASEPTTPPATAAPADNSGLEARPLALASGETVDFNGLLGQDVLFWFWAPW
ncbi:MAG: hypothetical protein AAFP84_03005 [Actinomycetota bacterium]